jgi:hypothetical protein
MVSKGGWEEDDGAVLETQRKEVHLGITATSTESCHEKA